MSVTDVLVEEGGDEFGLGAGVQVARDSLVLLHQTLVGLLQERCAGAVCDHELALVHVVLRSLLQKNLFKFLLVEFARVFAHFDQHLDGRSNLGFLDDFAVPLSPDFLNKKMGEAVTDHWVLDHVVLELRILHVLHQGQVELRHVVLVHVQQDVSDHHDALLDLLPDAVELFEELLVMVALDVLCDRLEQLNSGLLDAVVEHLAVLVQNQRVGGPVQLFVRQTTRLLVVDLVDGILDGLPVLLGLGSLHVGITHLVAVNQELVGWQI